MATMTVIRVAVAIDDEKGRQGIHGACALTEPSAVAPDAGVNSGEK